MARNETKSAKKLQINSRLIKLTFHSIARFELAEMKKAETLGKKKVKIQTQLLFWRIFFAHFLLKNYKMLADKKRGNQLINNINKSYKRFREKSLPKKNEKSELLKEWIAWLAFCCASCIFI